MSKSFNDILVVERAGQDNEAVLSITARLASSFAAHTRGLCLYSPPNPSPAECFAIGDKADGSVIRHLKVETDALLAPVEAKFRNRLVDCGATAQWESLPYSELVTEAAARVHSVDLAVLSRPVRHDHQSLELVDAYLLRGDVPCLLIPESAPHDAGFDRIVVAWNGSPEAWRTLDKALPFLHRAKAIKAIAVVAADIDSGYFDALQAFLLSHQIRAAAEHVNKADRIAQAILKSCSDLGADLLVMGAYGHSRQWEAIFGGVTRETLLSAPLPLFLSH